MTGALERPVAPAIVLPASGFSVYTAVTVSGSYSDGAPGYAALHLTQASLEKLLALTEESSQRGIELLGNFVAYEFFGGDFRLIDVVCVVSRGYFRIRATEKYLDVRVQSSELSLSRLLEGGRVGGAEKMPPVGGRA